MLGKRNETRTKRDRRGDTRGREIRDSKEKERERERTKREPGRKKRERDTEEADARAG